MIAKMKVMGFDFRLSGSPNGVVVSPVDKADKAVVLGSLMQSKIKRMEQKNIYSPDEIQDATNLIVEEFRGTVVSMNIVEAVSPEKDY